MLNFLFRKNEPTPPPMGKAKQAESIEDYEAQERENVIEDIRELTDDSLRSDEENAPQDDLPQDDLPQDDAEEENSSDIDSGEYVHREGYLHRKIDDFYETTDISIYPKDMVELGKWKLVINQEMQQRWPDNSFLTDDVKEFIDQRFREKVASFDWFDENATGSAVEVEEESMAVIVGQDDENAAEEITELLSDDSGELNDVGDVELTQQWTLQLFGDERDSFESVVIEHEDDAIIEHDPEEIEGQASLPFDNDADNDDVLEDDKPAVEGTHVDAVARDVSVLDGDEMDLEELFDIDIDFDESTLPVWLRLFHVLDDAGCDAIIDWAHQSSVEDMVNAVFDGQPTYVINLSECDYNFADGIHTHVGDEPYIALDAPMILRLCANQPSTIVVIGAEGMEAELVQRSGRLSIAADVVVDRMEELLSEVQPQGLTVYFLNEEDESDTDQLNTLDN